MAIRPWNLISSKKDGSFRIFGLRTDRAISPRTKNEHDFYVLESPGWVNVIPLTRQEEVVLVRQYRHGIRQVTLEIPGGLVEKGDSPEETAGRELLEETGYSASEMVLIGSVHANPAFMNNLCYTYLARDVSISGTQEQDEKEDIDIVVKPLKEIPRLIRDGEITHSLILAAFYRFYMEYLPSKP
ncbi:MAG TPA: NUDIX hydrolase [Desulfatiglandales bacterium]|nr:NUDIX hydrolase [Desulfatiglandales bacterium]